MFIGRENELSELTNEIRNPDKKSAVLIYGKRRVGKSTLIKEASRSFDGLVIHHICVNSTYEGNLTLLYQTISEALSLPSVSFNTIFDLMSFLGSTGRNILLILDEYPYLKQSGKKNEVDSYMQRVIDNLPINVKLILCGSYITIMKELLQEENPLFGRFTLIQHIREFDYYDAARFYPKLSINDKIAFYAVFGGSPFVLENLDYSASLKDNITRTLLSETGIIRSHIENIMLKEIKKNFDSRILETLGNGKNRYSDINSKLQNTETGLLDKQLKILLDMETIRKTEPINRKDDKKKQFYEITDNLMRFYFTFIFGKAGTIARIGSEQFCRMKIDPHITQFISRRFEGIAIQYFHRLSIAGKIPDIEDYGSYWYDDPSNKTNGEFDCVIKREGNKYDFYECKYYDHTMTQKECDHEKKQLGEIKGIDVSGVGFVCSGGFAFKDSKDFSLISGKDLYKARLF